MIETIGDPFQQCIYALTLLVPTALRLMQGSELHPAGDPWIGPGIDQYRRDLERAGIGDLPQRRVADTRLLVRVHIGAGIEKYSDDIEISAFSRVVQRRARDLIEP